MRNDSWLASLAHELEVLDVPATTRAEIVVETEGFLADCDESALSQFGLPDAYAASLASALDSRVRSRDDVATTPPSDAPAVSVTGLVRTFRRRVVLDGVSLTVPCGAIVALIGPNGVGKSTLLRIVAGLDEPDAGTVDVRGSVGYVPQIGGLDAYLRPDEHFELFGRANGRSRAAARTEGRRLAGELGWDAGAAPVVAELSGGTRQKLAVITALLAEPDVLLLDEPYQGMDADSSRRFWELLWAWGDTGGHSAIVSTHHSDVLRHADGVVELAEVSPWP